MKKTKINALFFTIAISFLPMLVVTMFEPCFLDGCGPNFRFMPQLRLPEAIEFVVSLLLIVSIVFYFPIFLLIGSLERNLYLDISEMSATLIFLEFLWSAIVWLVLWLMTRIFLRLQEGRYNKTINEFRAPVD